MSSTSSRFVHASWIPELVGVPAFRAFGDPDDGLRLTVLLADRLGDEVPSAREEIQACKTPKMPWKDRLDALQRLLDRVPRPSNRLYLGALIDPDALHPGRLSAKKLWRDRAFHKQRADLFDVLLRDATDRGGWLVLQPNPRRGVSEILSHELPRGEAEADPIARSDRELWTVASEIGAAYRPVLAWLVQTRKALGIEDARDVLDEQGAEELETYVLVLAYGLLKPSVQRVAQRLSALRGPQAVNGQIGGFSVTPPDAEARRAADAVERLNGLAVDARAVDTLAGCGFLQTVDPIQGRSSLQMPSPVRAFLRRLARLEEPHQWSNDNRVLGSRSIDSLPIEEQLEVHHHAVEGGNLADARRTARYYGADLRGLAFRMSHEKRYADAARVYQIILDEFDPEDAYAFEYLGYNLARNAFLRERGGGEPLAADERERILKAYETAADKAKMNPLYDGRLLGFRAQLGHPVRAKFEELMRSYRDTSRWKKAAMRYFAKAVFDGLERGGRVEERNELFRRWHKYLEGYEHFEKHHDD